MIINRHRIDLQTGCFSQKNESFASILRSVMEEKSNNMAGEMRDELAKIEAEFVMSPTQRRRKLIRWAIRQMLTVVLYYFFWNAHPWVPKSLWVVVPLALMSFFSIYSYNWLMKRKLRKTAGSIDRLDEVLKRPEEEPPEE